jgi:lipid-A-disaccharide synthase
LNDKPIIALLAGSRRQELKKNLPMMLRAANKFDEYQVVIAGAPGLSEVIYKDYIDRFPESKIIFDRTYELLSHAAIALVTSGTATLETALFEVPQIVCYNMSGGKIVNYIFDKFFKVPYISLVNLIAGKEIVRELLGAKFTEENILNEMRQLLDNEIYAAEMKNGYKHVISVLGESDASSTAAELILQISQGINYIS